MVRFFEDLIRSHVAERGKIYLLLNDIKAPGSLHITDPAFAQFIADHGGAVQDRCVTFDNVANCPAEWQPVEALIAAGDAGDVTDWIRVLLDSGRIDDAMRLADAGRGILAAAGTAEIVRQAISTFVMSVPASLLPDLVHHLGGWRAAGETTALASP